LADKTKKEDVSAKDTEKKEEKPEEKTKTDKQPEKKSKPEEKMAEEPKIEEKPEEPEKSKQKEQETDKQKTSEEDKTGETQKETEQKIEEKVEKTKQEPKKEEKKQKTSKDEKKDDFQYIVRLSNTDVDGEKKLIYGLNSIKGIGLHLATLISDETNIDRNLKIGKLTDKQIEKLQNAIDNVQQIAPKWMLNHRKDMEVGKDIHLIGSEIDMKLRDEINTMKKIRSYKGIRHERGLRARGQRTRGNNRTGLTLGVSKKSVQQKKSK